MTRIPTHTVADAPEKSREIVAKFEKRMGRLMNIHAGMADSPAVIAAYDGIQTAIGRLGTFDPRTRETIALAVGNEDGCDYCQAAHTVSAKRAGLSEDETIAIRADRIDFDARLAGIAALAREAARNTGSVSEATWQEALAAGWSEADLSEAFVHVAANLFTNYFNHYAGTELDVPPAPALPES
ncbi:carboxymuconolactone decarboxylase family protein [Rathayibacter soli]|uniref:carboxymuconolactone decarboxylase family protein n=1 Tax=Rathayibacter soli TaxID=3144168 RepID=UPI0027E3D701|nr:carboxymuconolactone decarboxylase family protein [Glaciibacter superstes]